MASEEPSLPSPLHVFFEPLEGRAVLQAVHLLLVEIDGHVLNEKPGVRYAGSHDQPLCCGLIVTLASRFAFFTSVK